MDDRLYKVLKYVAVLMVVLLVGIGLYDGLVRGKDAYSLGMAAGHRYFEDGDFKAALREFRTAGEAVPGDPDACYGEAIALLQLGRSEEALTFFDRAIEGAVDSRDKAFFLANRGILHDRAGHYRLALADYRMALQLAPETAEGPGVISRLLHNQQRKPPTIMDRALYLQSELAKPESERLLTVPAIDERQRSEKVR